MTSPENKPQNKINLYLFNLGIFLGYFLIASVIAKNYHADFGQAIVCFGYLAHSIILILISIVQLIRGRSQKIKTGAGAYFLCAILLLLIGFGACSMSWKLNWIHLI